MKLSLVVPCYNEAENVAPFQDAVISAFDGCGYDFEIIFVNDGSRDATLHNLKKLHAQQKCPVKVISFSRNFGKEAGLYAGLQHASGEYISLIDADLQQRPEIVRDMVKILDEQPQYDVVAAYQDRRAEGKVLSFFKKRGSPLPHSGQFASPLLMGNLLKNPPNRWCGGRAAHPGC